MDRTVFKGYNYPSESQIQQPQLPEAPPPPPLNNSIFDNSRQPPVPLQVPVNQNQFDKQNIQQAYVPSYNYPSPQLGSYSQNIYYSPLNQVDSKQGENFHSLNNLQCNHIEEISPSFHYTNTSYILLFDLILSILNVIMFLIIILPCYLATLSDKYKKIPQIQRIKCQTCKITLREQPINQSNEPPFFWMCIKIIGVIIFFMIWQKTGQFFFVIYFRIIENIILFITYLLSRMVSKQESEEE